MAPQRIEIRDQQTGRSLSPFDNPDPGLASLKSSVLNLRESLHNEELERARTLVAELRALSRSPLVKDFQEVLRVMNTSVFLSEWRANEARKAAGLFSPIHLHSYYLCLVLTPSGFRVGGGDTTYLERVPRRFRFGFSRQLTVSLVRIGVTPESVRENLLDQIQYVKARGVVSFDPQAEHVIPTRTTRERELREIEKRLASMRYALFGKA